MNQNTKYVAGLAAARLSAIAAAQTLPDGGARNAQLKLRHNALVEKKDIALERWGSLDGYIGKAYRGEFYKPQINAAGKKYYRSAQRKNWENVRELMKSGKKFIENHLDALKNDGGMPGAFPDRFLAAKGEFEQAYENFMDVRQNAEEETDTKVLANNEIYLAGRKMMDDGKLIFRKNAAVRMRFVWRRIMTLVAPDGKGKTSAVKG